MRKGEQSRSVSRPALVSRGALGADGSRPPVVARRRGLTPPVVTVNPRAPRSPTLGAKEAPSTASMNPIRNPLLRLLAINTGLGMLVGQAALWLVLGFDVAGLGSAVFASDSAPLVIVILSIKFGLTFAAGVVATAVMSMPYGDEDPQSSGRR